MHKNLKNNQQQNYLRCKYSQFELLHIWHPRIVQVIYIFLEISILSIQENNSLEFWEIKNILEQNMKQKLLLLSSPTLYQNYLVCCPLILRMIFCGTVNEQYYQVRRNKNSFKFAMASYRVLIEIISCFFVLDTH